MYPRKRRTINGDWRKDLGRGISPVEEPRRGGRGKEVPASTLFIQGLIGRARPFEPQSKSPVGNYVPIGPLHCVVETNFSILLGSIFNCKLKRV